MKLLTAHVCVRLGQRAGAFNPHGRSLAPPFVSESSQGVGLGLTISRDLAHACGGELDIRNRRDAQTQQVLGLSATLWLPAHGS